MDERDERLLRGLAALPPDVLAAITRALEARDWEGAIAILRTVSAEFKQRRAALRDVKIGLAVQRLELGAQQAALDVLKAAAVRRHGH